MAKLQAMEDNKTANSQSQQQKSEDSFEIPPGLLDYMETLLDAVAHTKVQACNISLVPEKLRKSKAEAYMPQVVSIGPVHRGTRTKLLYMEEIKWRCMKHLFKRTEFDEVSCLRKCSRAMLMIDDIVRASYVDNIKFNRDDLAKISVLDGCFLLELLITRYWEQTAKENDLLASPGAEVIKREEVLSDLMLLDNQIPIIVLDTLSNVLFGKLYKMVDCTKLIHECALSILGYNYNSGSLNLGSDHSNLRAFNLVELVHSFIDKEINDVDKDSTKIDIESEQVVDRLRCCVSRLEAAGVTIIGVETKNERPYRFDLKINFSDGELKIPQLHITRTTEAKWRNLIAWEVNRTNLVRRRVGKEAKTRCQFISYAWFIQSLICCVHDVKLLRDRKVILVDEMKTDKGKKNIMSDEELLNLFSKLTDGVSKTKIEMDPRFVQEIHKLNKHNRTVDLATETGRVMWHIFRCFLTWIRNKCIGSFKVLKRDYLPTGWALIAVLAAAFGLFLTGVQTYYSIPGN